MEINGQQSKDEKTVNPQQEANEEACRLFGHYLEPMQNGNEMHFRCKRCNNKL
jgi:hypothetical protein